MKNIVILALLITGFSNAQNSMLNADFWKKNPDLNAITAEIKKGNNPAEANRGNFDVASLAINNNASMDVILYLIEQPGNSVNKLTHDGRTYLHWAASKGNVPLVKYLLEKGADVHLTDDKGATPIAFAAGGGQAETAVYDLLFKAGNKPTQKFKDGANLLLLSIANDPELKLSDYLSTKGLSLNDKDDLGNTAFNYAAKSGNLQLLKLLNSKKIKFDGRALVMASQGSRYATTPLETYKYLVDDLKLNVNSVGDNGDNVLHNLVRKQKQNEIITYFLNKGVNVNLQDKEGNTPLMNAVRGGVDVVELLLPKVNDINAVNAKGASALSFAVETGASTMVDYLLGKGANVQVLDKKGNNLAYYLIQSYKPNTRNDSNDFLVKFDLLQKAGLNLAEAQKDGNTLYHLAIAKNDVSLLEIIESLKIDLNAKNGEGMTALQRAALTAKDDAILKFLVAKGAKKDIKTEFDETAYDLAKENELLTQQKVSVEFLK